LTTAAARTIAENMAVKITDLLGSQLNALRYEPTAKRLRASVGGHVVADTYDGLLVWEPKRVVPAYAVAEKDISARLIPTEAGRVFDVDTGDTVLPRAAFKPDDPDLQRHVLLDFAAFDWLEEDEPIVGHPHDPFHRIDILRSSRHVSIELDGHVLAESSRPVLLFETLLPVRFYLPPEDVTSDLEHSDTVTYCAYKGRASYLSLPGVRADVAWTYREPLREAEPIREHVCFFDEHVDVTVDGQRRDRPSAPWSE